MFNFFRKKTVTKDKFPEIIDGLYLGVFLACSAATTVIHKRLKEIDPKFDIESLPSVQQKLFDMTFDIKGLYENLYGYQVTCVVGFLSQEKLIEFMDILVLKDMLLEKIESSTGMGRKEIESYNEDSFEKKTVAQLEEAIKYHDKIPEKIQIGVMNVVSNLNLQCDTQPTLLSLAECDESNALSH